MNHIVGAALLGYTVLREIGEGGMGKVYLAENAAIGQQVAIKILDPVLARSLELRERFNQEARIQVALQHNNIVRILNAQSTDEISFLVMEYIDGESLDKVLKRRGRLSVDEAIKIMRQVLDAVGYAHSNGIIHRDLKPSNILVCADGTAKVTDFGIAKVLGDTKLTRTGTSMGSPDYMSPEQVLGKKDIDHRTDIYSLGATLYEMLTGRPPFVFDNGGTSDSDFLLKEAHVNRVPKPPKELNGDIPSPVSDAVVVALSKLPSDRFSSCTDLTNALIALRASANLGFLGKKSGGNALNTRGQSSTRVSIPPISYIAYSLLIGLFLGLGGTVVYLRKRNSLKNIFPETKDLIKEVSAAPGKV